MQNTATDKISVLNKGELNPEPALKSSLQLKKASSNCQADLLRPSGFQIKGQIYKEVKKQAQMFIRAQKKGFLFSKSALLENKLQQLLDLIKGAPEAFKSLYNHKAQTNFKKIEPKLIKFRRINKSAEPKIVILSAQSDLLGRTNEFLQVTVISFPVKMDYCLSNIEKFEDLSLCVKQISKQLRNTFLFIEGTDELNQLLGRANQKFQQVFSNFQSLNCMPSNLSNQFPNFILFQSKFQNTDVNSYNNRIEELQTALVKYRFVKQSLLKNMANLVNESSALGYVEILPFAFNLVAPMISMGKGTYHEQMSNCLPEIQLLFKELSQNQRKVEEQGDYGYSDHLPNTSLNSHTCWGCKARVLIKCSTCSVIQDRVVSLCLQCYAPYHQFTHPDVQHGQNSSLLDKWERVDQQIDAMLERESQLHNMPLIYPVKEESCE